MNIPNAISIWTGTTVGISVLPNGVVLIIFDNAVKRVNLLSSLTLEELKRCLDEVDKLKAVSGIVFLSAKEGCFIAGADITEIAASGDQPATSFFNACQNGKTVLNRIANTSYPTVAAINGRCLGGGAELALVCKKRLAADTEMSVIGLPEVGLGLLPGWGGTVRSTRMLGIANAMPLVLDPLKPWSAKKAWRLGLVSEVVPAAQLTDRAIAVAMGSSTKDYRNSFQQRLVRRVTDTFIGRRLVAAIAVSKIKKSPLRDCPAPYAIVKVMVRALGGSVSEAFMLESHTFARLAKTPESGQAIRQFLQRDKKA